MNYGEHSDLAYWINSQLQVTNPALILSASNDNYFYSIANEFGATHRIKIYTSDGSPMFNTPIEDVGNPTYAELDGRIGFQVCLAASG